jgi:hypothetical protein
LLFDLLARKKENEKERFYTFLHFRKLLDGQKDRRSLSVWEPVLELFHLLREWFEDRDLYHKVGYLVTIGVGLDELVDESDRSLTKSGFRAVLDDRIKASLDLDLASARELSYDDRYETCARLLLLFNVESVRRLEHSSERYPFHSHKMEKWSLEHIHAQHAGPLNTEKEWRSWLGDSVRALAALHAENPTRESDKVALIGRIEDVLAGSVKGPDFTALSHESMDGFLNPAGTEHAVHSIANLALLSGSVNSALSNGAFQAKRLRVIDLDREGKFIPICTRRVFLKYYAKAGSEQVYWWSRDDQQSYVEQMLSSSEGIGMYLTPAMQAQK